METKFNMRKVTLVGGVIILISLIPIAETLWAQKGDENGKNNKDSQSRVDIQVKKHKDRNGNFNSYDSTYTWSWSNNGNMPANVDSVFKSMYEHFSKNFSFETDSFFSMPFGFRSPCLKDTSITGDPFNDWFGDDWANMDRVMRQHQKMMEEFFHHKPLLEFPGDVDKPAPKQNERQKQKEEKKDGEEIIKNNSDKKENSVQL